MASNFWGPQGLTQDPWNSVPSAELCAGGLTLEGQSKEGQESLERIFLTLETLFLNYVKAIEILPPFLPLEHIHFFCLSLKNFTRCDGAYLAHSNTLAFNLLLLSSVHLHSSSGKAL